MFKCNKCSSAFAKASTLASHLENTHKIQTNFKCPNCDFIGPSWDSIRRHLKSKCTQKQIQKSGASFVSENFENENMDYEIQSDSNVHETSYYGKPNEDSVKANEDSVKANEDSVKLKLKKKLAKIIIDTKYEYNVSQVCIDNILNRFNSLFNQGIELIEVSTNL